MIKFKGISRPTIDMLKDIRETGKCKKLQQQWRRSWGKVTTEDFFKIMQLHTKRLVKVDGKTRPFANYKQFTELKSKTLILKNNKFIYI